MPLYASPNLSTTPLESSNISTTSQLQSSTSMTSLHPPPGPTMSPALITEHIARSDDGPASEGAKQTEGVGNNANSPPLPAREGETVTTDRARHREPLSSLPDLFRSEPHPRCTNKSPDNAKHDDNNANLPISAREGESNSSINKDNYRRKTYIITQTHR